MEIQIDSSVRILVGRREYAADATAEGFRAQVGDAGELLVSDQVEQVSAEVMRIRRRWQYRGARVEQVRLINQFRTADFYPTPDYYTYAGIVWNGNRFGVGEHAFGEHKREERFCVRGVAVQITGFVAICALLHALCT